MESLLVPGLLLAVLVAPAATPPVRAQEKLVQPPQPEPSANPSPPGPSGAPEYSASCAWFRKVVHGTVENVPHTCIRYDVKEEDYCPTRCGHMPILSKFCDRHCGKHGCGHDEDAPCPQCGHPRTRKVLIKEFVTEDVPTPKCAVERVPCPRSCTGPAPSSATSLSGEPVVLPPGDLKANPDGQAGAPTAM